MWELQGIRVVKFFPIQRLDGTTGFGRVKSPTAWATVQHSRSSSTPLQVGLRWKTKEWVIKYPDSTAPEMERSRDRMVLTGNTKVVKGPVDVYPDTQFLREAVRRFGPEFAVTLVTALLAAH